MIDINNYLIEQGYVEDENNIFKSGKQGYWSNLSKEENENFTEILNNSGTRAAVKSINPQYEEMIYSEKREAALELLDHEQPGICIDYGCMWGVLSIGMAKRGHHVVAVDQTYPSLDFLHHRIKEDKLDKVTIVQDDIKKIEFKELADYALVNGVLEWIPIIEDVEVKDYYSGNSNTNATKSPNPKNMQEEFINTVFTSLKKGGKMLLAIENRHCYQYYMGRKDPHANLLFTTFLPRFISTMVSKIFHHKSYRNYIYSFKDMESIVKKSGFIKCEQFMSFPDYHFPELILEYSKHGLSQYRKYPNKLRTTKKQKIAYYVEYFIMKYFGAKFFAPAIVIVATK